MRRSWAALGASVGGPVPLLGPLWVVLGRSRGLCGRSWAALGASVGGPGLLSGPLCAVLAEKWPWLERERDLGRVDCVKIPKPPKDPEAPSAFVQ